MGTRITFILMTSTLLGFPELHTFDNHADNDCVDRTQKWYLLGLGT